LTVSEGRGLPTEPPANTIRFNPEIDEDTMIDLMSQLEEMDAHLEERLIRVEPEELRDEVYQLLTRAAEAPGRASKLRVTYILERLAETAHSLRDSGEHGFYKRFSPLMVWIDLGLQQAAYLVNPDSAGRFLEAFDQTSIEVEVRNPKDPQEEQRRQKQVQDLKKRWAVMDPGSTRASEPTRPGGIIVPGREE
jgi:hypothetical protein